MKWQLLLMFGGEWTMAQHIPEHLCRYLAEAVVILIIIVSVICLVQEWGSYVPFSKDNNKKNSVFLPPARHGAGFCCPRSLEEATSCWLGIRLLL
jgi:hypothetical protein